MDPAADSSPIELTRVRKRRTTGPRDAAPAPEPTAQPGSVRRRRQTGTMSLGEPASEAAPADLEPPAPEVTAGPPAPSAPAPLDSSARSRDRSREREALERVLALAKPRTRQTRATPAVLPPSVPSDDDGDGGESGPNG